MPAPAGLLFEAVPEDETLQAKLRALIADRETLLAERETLAALLKRCAQ